MYIESGGEARIQGLPGAWLQVSQESGGSQTHTRVRFVNVLPALEDTPLSLWRGKRE